MSEVITVSAKSMPLIQESMLRDLLTQGVVGNIRAVGVPGGFELHMHVGRGYVALGTARGTLRIFGSLNTLACLLKRLNQDCFSVSFGAYTKEVESDAQPALKYL